MDFFPGYAESREVLHRLGSLSGPNVGQRVDADRLSGPDREHGLLVDGVPAPAHGLRARGHEVVSASMLPLVAPASGPAQAVAASTAMQE